MNITNDKPVMVFKNEYNGKVFYNMGLSRKDLDGNWENGSIGVQFKKGVSLNNQTKIIIKNAWLTFYKKDKITVPYIFINEFEVENEVQEEFNPFADFGDNMPF